MPENDFLKQQRAAVERMRELNSRSKFGSTNESRNTAKKMQDPPKETKKCTEKPKTEEKNENGARLGIPFLDNILKDKDAVIILGLLLLLMSENTDKTLLFALVYILL